MCRRISVQGEHTTPSKQALGAPTPVIRSAYEWEARVDCGLQPRQSSSVAPVMAIETMQWRMQRTLRSQRGLQ